MDVFQKRQIIERMNDGVVCEIESKNWMDEKLRMSTIS